MAGDWKVIGGDKAADALIHTINSDIRNVASLWREIAVCKVKRTTTFSKVPWVVLWVLYLSYVFYNVTALSVPRSSYSSLCILHCLSGSFD